MKQLKVFIFELIVLFFAIYSPSIYARTRTVPGDYHTIQAAIFASDDGDSVRVGAGLYRESLNFGGRDITVIGNQLDPSDVIIDLVGQPSAILFTHRESEAAELSGFTIRNGNSDLGGAIYCASNSNPTISYCCFQDNFADISGGAIFCSTITNASATIINCTFSGNQAERGDAIVGGSDMQIINCLFWGDRDQSIRLEGENNSINCSLIQRGQRAIAGDVWGEGNIELNPEFIDLNDNDFHLNNYSPAIDAGDPDLPRDLDGTARDIGAFYTPIGGAREILALSDTIQFDGVYLHHPKVCSLSVRNLGGENLTISEILIDGDGFELANDGSFEIAPRQNATVNVSLNPDQAGEYNGTLIIVSDDPRHGETDIILHGNGVLNSQIWVEPTEFTLALDSSDVLEYIFNIANDGDGILEYTITQEYGENNNGVGNWRENDQSNAPSRDSAGDFLGRIAVPYPTTVGMAFDGEKLWGASDGGAYLYSIDPETFEVVDYFHIQSRPRGLAYHDEHFVTSYPSTDTFLYTYDANGEYLGELDTPVRDVSGIAFDNDGHLFLANYQFQKLYILSADDLEIITEINLREQLNQPGYKAIRLDWVETHAQGQLWMLMSNSQAHISKAVQCRFIEDWTLEEVQDFRLRYYGNTGITTDNSNLWHGGEQNGRTWAAYDNGINEQVWLWLEEDQGTLESWEDTDILFRISASQMSAGNYTNTIHVLSNDPDLPDIAITIELDIIQSVIEPDNSSPAIAEKFSLDGCFPNPFNQQTTISYSLIEDSPISLSVLSADGRLIARIFDGFQTAGKHNIAWTPDNISAGVYLINLETAGQQATLKTLYLP